ncbi:MAG: lysophospholipid acyltransferase family protein [Bacteriovoracaceae bacterium]|nr:lysophospholipid acyltransferase family protein [Bacteriovoracaceae bacterium]
MNTLIINLAALLLKLFSFTIRVKRHHPDINTLVREAGYKNFTVALWHNDITSCLFTFRKGQYAVMVSQSKDGEIATRIAGRCSKFRFVRGSASRGAKSALMQLIRTMKNENIPGALTVDGPRGPRHVVKAGIVELAKLTNTCIIPVSFYPERHYIFKKSWDRFRIPLPFTTLHCDIGVPIVIPVDLDKERYSEYCELIRNQLYQTEENLINKTNSKTPLSEKKDVNNNKSN